MLFFAILQDILIFHGTMFQFLKHLDPQLYIQLLSEKFTIMINDATAFIVQFKLRLEVMLHQVDEPCLAFLHQKLYLLQAFDHLYQHI